MGDWQVVWMGDVVAAQTTKSCNNDVAIVSEITGIFIFAHMYLLNVLYFVIFALPF